MAVDVCMSYPQSNQKTSHFPELASPDQKVLVTLTTEDRCSILSSLHIVDGLSILVSLPARYQRCSLQLIAITYTPYKRSDHSALSE